MRHKIIVKRQSLKFTLSWQDPGVWAEHVGGDGEVVDALELARELLRRERDERDPEQPGPAAVGPEATLVTGPTVRGGGGGCTRWSDGSTALERAAC